MEASLQTARLSVFFVLGHVAFGAVPLIGDATHFSASKFLKYVDSTTNFSVSGWVMVEQMPETPPRFGGLGMLPYQRVSWDLAGIDPACSGGDGGRNINRCGIHIHEGRSCSEDAGGHLYKGTTRLRFYGAYYAAANTSRSISGALVARHGAHYAAANLDASVSGAPVSVFTNLTASDISGRAVIVYDSTPPGRPIACALLSVGGPSHATMTSMTTTASTSTSHATMTFMTTTASTSTFLSSSSIVYIPVISTLVLVAATI